MAVLQQLHTLDVESNKLTGDPFATVLYALPKMISIRLSENQFAGELDGIAAAATAWSSMLRELWLGDNLFKGVLPTEIGQLESLGTSWIRQSEQTNARGKGPRHVG